MHKNYIIITGENQLDFFNDILTLRKSVWPEFIRVSDETILKIYQLFPDFQITLIDSNSREIIGIANAIPFNWSQPFIDLPNEGVSWIMEYGLSFKHNRMQPNSLCAVSISIASSQRNKGISKILLQYMKQICLDNHIKNLVVPLRPSLKSIYPLIPIEKYIAWKNKKGEPYDPWLRIHTLLNATFVKICPFSASIKATINQWKIWTGLDFPGEGKYIIPNGLVPIEIDHHNQGIYIEPNIWVRYTI